MEANFVQNVKKYESSFSQTTREFNLQIVNQTRRFTSTFSPIGVNKSAYQEWLDLGNVGSPQDFIDSLKEVLIIEDLPELP